MNKKMIIEKLINETASKDYTWQPYLNNEYEFKHTFFENSQHFMPTLSYVLNASQGIFFLASFRAMVMPDGIAEEIALLFFKSGNENLEERIDDNSPDLYALRKLIELNNENIYPNLNSPVSSGDLDNPSDALSDFLK
ncbi:hypothetical protein [Enterococcus pallens]|uniref:Uncharacterized protein n=1 Tax=Enterococcus pallens ATCC BAA-351 TaxID=1158607 RepID=R2T800_9ENTE|nr:hypothetical protein [Enterococcus pallens]EOH94814.1 hypothetical protein UAU_01736 [Enterococcus pallens ATCC BAA-351]EOH96369.1 hypothetical protein UAU_01019 [Enterococcus pallens ATCC BAA-351]EOU14418.1 hypothetical protein I588_04775 [Enterococcus pallens ATCC BAA-351]EOU14867.1 hypothetical protein I588_04517 [Enterococcus pallens ATCC BAA-351]OJG69738.1 hypothetical protein RV10_GL000738 [Enterococcus pallens]